MIPRISSAVILMLSVLFAPFWVTVLLAFAGMAYFSFFIEAVFLLLLSDLLFAVKVEPSQGDGSTFTLISFTGAIVCFVILELFKKKLRLNKY